MKKVALALIMCIMCVFIHAQDIEADKDKVIKNQNTATQEQIQPNKYVYKKESRFNWYIGLGLYQRVGNIQPSFPLNLIQGFEWKFYKGNGINVSFLDFNFNNFELIDFRYFYETQHTSLKYAILTGLDFGAKLDKVYLLNKNLVRRESIEGFEGLAGMSYNIGLRLRKKKYAVLFDVNIPLYSAIFKRYSPNKVYAGISMSANYIYFFGKKD